MPNDDLISRKALSFEISTKSTLYDGSRIGKGIGLLLNKSEVLGRIDAAPAVDAEPVRHGKWIENYAYGAWHYDCPFCDDGYATKKREKKPVNYCSNCGAKMDKEE